MEDIGTNPFRLGFKSSHKSKLVQFGAVFYKVEKETLASEKELMVILLQLIKKVFYLKVKESSVAN